MKISKNKKKSTFITRDKSRHEKVDDPTSVRMFLTLVAGPFVFVLGYLKKK